MRDLKDLIRYRTAHPTLGHGDSEGGCFMVQSPLQKNKNLTILASTGEGWDHVSVSLPHRCPTWAEMDFVKRLFFHPDEIVMQLHVKESDHIDLHPFCLHLWRPQKETIPMPPKWMV